MLCPCFPVTVRNDVRKIKIDINSSYLRKLDLKIRLSEGTPKHSKQTDMVHTIRKKLLLCCTIFEQIILF